MTWYEDWRGEGGRIGGGRGEGGRAGKNKCVRAWVEGELHVSVHVCRLHAHARGRIKIHVHVPLNYLYQLEAHHDIDLVSIFYKSLSGDSCRWTLYHYDVMRGGGGGGPGGRG